MYGQVIHGEAMFTVLFRLSDALIGNILFGATWLLIMIVLELYLSILIYFLLELKNIVGTVEYV